MLNSDTNIFKTGYMIDAKPLESQGRVVAYKIVKVHDKFEID